MARPQSDAKLGFFPFPEPCLPLLARHLGRPADPAACYVLDPCAGEGVAVNYLAKTLDVPGSNVFAVELSTARSETIRREYPETRILGPASFTGIAASYNCFSLSYVNPPYSDEMGGGRREELTFLVRTINHAAAGGVVVLVVPEHVVFEWGSGAESMRRTISARLEGTEFLKLPDEHRRYKEIVVIGRKSRQFSPDFDLPRWWEARDRTGVLGDVRGTFTPPPGKPPKRWEQTAYTPEELRREVARSPLAAHLEPPRPSQAATPPLPPGKGHTALILASGDLDGLVWPAGEPPHVVRGTSRKVRYRDAAKCERKANDDGSTSEKDVFSERITLFVRAVGVDGKVHTFTDNQPTEDATDAPEPEEEAE